MPTPHTASPIPQSRTPTPIPTLPVSTPMAAQLDQATIAAITAAVIAVLAPAPTPQFHLTSYITKPDKYKGEMCP